VDHIIVLGEVAYETKRCVQQSRVIRIARNEFDTIGLASVNWFMFVCGVRAYKAIDREV
jgi:hypothetical protein